MSSRYSFRDMSDLEPNQHCPGDKQINILLLGPTGVGKSTFINALANYLINNTLKEAERDEMNVIIPASFTYDDTKIFLGTQDEYEQFSTEGQPATQQCRSFLFPIGDRILRFIDTPGIGDCRGPDQDAANFQEILNYISQYEHLNGVCILLKPDEQRLNILFRFCVNELLRHLHKEAKENLMFIFTNSRATFYSPGATKKLVDALLAQHKDHYDVTIPFSTTNTFSLDNEAFRYLALRKQGIELDEYQTESYTQSWDRSVLQYGRMMKYIVTRPLHAISGTLSLNEAEQLIRKLPRPIAETAKLIEENIQLAKDHKKRVLQNPSLASQGIPQLDVTVKILPKPRTVCISDKCCRVIEDGQDKKIEYTSICHDECYLTGVMQETLADPRLRDCTAIHYKTSIVSFDEKINLKNLLYYLFYLEKCLECGCYWRKHKHITYEYKTNRVMSLGDIDRRITDLRNEAAKIQEVYKKLVKFLHVNAMIPINDDIENYLEYFIHEEELKRDAGAANADVIANLKEMLKNYKKDIGLFKKTLEEQKKTGNVTDVIASEEIFTLVGELHRLPITGKQIRAQINGIKFSQEGNGTRRETNVNLPGKAASSKIMNEMREAICPNVRQQNSTTEDKLYR